MTTRYEEKLNPNVTGAFEAVTGTNQCLSYLRRAPAVCPVDICHRCAQVQVATTRGIAGDTRGHEATEEGTRPISLEPSRRGWR